MQCIQFSEMYRPQNSGWINPEMIPFDVEMNILFCKAFKWFGGVYRNDVQKVILAAHPVFGNVSLWFGSDLFGGVYH